MLQKNDFNTLTTIGRLFRLKKKNNITGMSISNALAFIAYAETLPDDIDYEEIDSDNGKIIFLTFFENNDEDEIITTFHNEDIYVEWQIGNNSASNISTDIISSVEAYNNTVKMINEQNNPDKNKMRHKIAINIDFGGFSLSKEALDYLKRKGITDEDTLAKYEFGHVPRHDKLLIETIERLGKNAEGTWANLSVIEIEENQYRITEYDGLESIETPSDINYITINENE